MTSTSAPKRQKGSSKKNKKSWRKNADIADVEEYLEDQRLEARLGGPFDERQDEELFVIDKGQEDKKKGEEAKSNLTRRAARKKAAAENPLRCHSSLLPAVPEVKGKTPEERRNPIIKAKEKKLTDKGIVK